MSDAYEQRYSEPKRSGGGGGAMKVILGLGCGCLGLVMICAGGCGGFFYYGVSKLKQTKPWTDTVAKANANTDVTSELGSPVEGMDDAG